VAEAEEESLTCSSVSGLVLYLWTLPVGSDRGLKPIDEMSVPRSGQI
jgi:hypothetical protein